MFKSQSSLGNLKPYKPKAYNHLKVAKIIGVKDWEKKKQIDVRFEGGHENGGITTIWITENNTNVEPKEGDKIIVGFIDGVKTNGILISYLMDQFKYANKIKINNLGVKICWEIDGKDAFIFLRSNGKIEIVTEGNLEIKAAQILIDVKNIIINAESINVNAPGGSIIYNTVNESGNGAIVTIAGNLNVDKYVAGLVTNGNLP